MCIEQNQGTTLEYNFPHLQGSGAAQEGLLVPPIKPEDKETHSILGAPESKQGTSALEIITTYCKARHLCISAKGQGLQGARPVPKTVIPAATDAEISRSQIHGLSGLQSEFRAIQYASVKVKL